MEKRRRGVEKSYEGMEEMKVTRKMRKNRLLLSEDRIELIQSAEKVRFVYIDINLNLITAPTSTKHQTLISHPRLILIHCRRSFQCPTERTVLLNMLFNIDSSVHTNFLFFLIVLDGVMHVKRFKLLTLIVLA